MAAARLSSTVLVLAGALLIASALASLAAQEKQRPLRLIVHVARVHDEAAIESEFDARSTPGSAKFRQFLNDAELRELIAARPESVAAVQAYLSAQPGVANVRLLESGDIVVCDVEAAFAVQLPGFIAAERQSVALPAAVSAHVRRAVVLGVRLSRGRKGAAASSSSASVASSSSSGSSGQPGMTQTPASIRARYHVPDPSTLPALPSNYTQGVAEFEGEYFYESDIEAFASRFGLTNVSIPIMGPTASSSGADATEGTLDLEYMAAIAGGSIPTWWLAQNTDNNDPGNIDFSLWCDQVLRLSPRPYVVSISWGSGYERYENDTNVMIADNDAFRKLGLVGISVFAASGDSGPGVRSEEFNCNTFTPSWPSSSPYLTSVGATYALSAGANEESVNWSGGGFSTVFTRPSYQEAAVKKYFEVASGSLPKPSFYKATGRGYPDVSALGTNFEVVVAGQWQPVSGTSAASPTFAGIVSLIVAERVGAGLGPLGFLNPKLYSLGKVGFDVTQGRSIDTNCFEGPIQGFPAVAGWDAVSGLGTPDYTFLKQNL